MRRAAAGLLLALGVGRWGVAHAQTDRLAGRLAEPTHAAALALIDSARAAGLPADPLVNKALEGASKGADGPRILAAMRLLAHDLGVARDALGTTSSESELVAGGAALRAGVAPDFLARLRHEHPDESVVVPLAVMADLVTSGVPADTAARDVLTLAHAGLREAQLVEFRRDVERDIALGAPAGASAAVRVSAAARGVAAAPATPTGGTPPRRKP